MKLATFELGGQPRLGAVIDGGQRLLDLAGAFERRHRRPEPALAEMLALIVRRLVGGSDAGRGQGVHGAADGLAEHRVVGFEADARRAKRLDQVTVLLAGGVGVQATLDGVDEAGQLGPVFVPFPRALDGDVELVEEAAQVLFHARTLPRDQRAGAPRRASRWKW